MPPDTVVQEDEIEGWAGGEGGGAPSRRRPSHNPRLAVRSAPFVEDGGPAGRLWPPYRSQREELLGKTTILGWLRVKPFMFIQCRSAAPRYTPAERASS